jgi:CSLREA domain-containing protein
MNRNHSLRTSAYFLFIGMVLLAIIGYYAVVPQSAATVAPFAVNSTADATDASPGDGICDDGTGHCTLRAAIVESDFSGGSTVINVPAGTYTLTGPADDEFNGAGATLDTGDLDIVDLGTFGFPSLISVTINGAGSGTTIIDGGGVDRVFDINNFAAVGASVDVTLSGLTIRNGNAATSEGYNPSGAGIQFDGFNNGTFVPAGTLTITDCKITSNTAAGQGGGILAIFGSLNMTGSEVSGNTATNGAGGGISYDGSAFGGSRTLSITTSKLSGNHANSGTFGSGGGIWAGGNANKSITKTAITTNHAGAHGGGVFNGSGSLTLNYNAIVGNTSSGAPPSSGIRNNTGAINADNNWWGCNAGPSMSPCDRAAGTFVSLAAWLQLHHTATPGTVNVNQSTTLQADFFTNNLNTGINAADLVALNGRAVTFNNEVLGMISGEDATINAGKANATYTAGGLAGNGSAQATVDTETQTASIIVAEAPTVDTNPTDQTVCDGHTATFTAAASGFPAPTVQWQVSTGGGPFTNISGATSTTLMFTATLADNGNQYRAVFTSPGGTATTTAATLTVVVTQTTDPADQSICPGATASFSTTASGIGPFTFVWKKGATVLNNGDLGGRVTITSTSTTSTLSISNAQASDAGTYSVETTGQCGTATQSASLSTTDAIPPQITCPANITADATCPAGAIVTYATPTATDNCGTPTVARTAGLASGAVFPIGTTTVTYTATDGSGNSTSCSFMVTVLTPQASLQNLINSVNASSLTGTQKNGLLAKLNAALQAINSGQTNVACNKLAEFNNSVGVLINNGSISMATGNAWIASANKIRNVIGCTNNGCS